MNKFMTQLVMTHGHLKTSPLMFDMWFYIINFRWFIIVKSNGFVKKLLWLKKMHNFQSHGITLEQSNKHINCNTFINVQYATLQK